MPSDKVDPVILSLASVGNITTLQQKIPHLSSNLPCMAHGQVNLRIRLVGQFDTLSCRPRATAAESIFQQKAKSELRR